MTELTEVVRRFIIVCEDDYSSDYARVLAFARIRQDAEDALRAALRSTPAAPPMDDEAAEVIEDVIRVLSRIEDPLVASEVERLAYQLSRVDEDAR